MPNRMFFVSLILSFLLGTCGDSSDVGIFGTLSKDELDPWLDAGVPSLPTGPGEVTGNVRTLVFADGMIISYDGSSQLGEEKICRGYEREGSLFRVCMSLEEDPYFMVWETNSLHWRPTIFESFSTELVCTRDDDERDCEGEIFPIIGGDGFRCWAGVQNGDRALLCSDDWAVVANGTDDATKTVCRVHVKTGSGICLGSPQEGVADETLIGWMQKSSWAGLRSPYANPRQVLAGDSVQAMAPQNLPAGAKLTYQSQDEDLCQIDNDGSDGGVGEVTVAHGAMVPSYCNIVLKIVADGFVDRVVFVRLEVVMDSDAAWADYVPPNGVLYVGESLAAGAVTSSDPASPELEYTSKDESVCTIDESGTIIAVGEGLCKVVLLATAEHYRDIAIEKSVMVAALSRLSAIEWPSFPTNAMVGTPTGVLDDPVVRGTGGIKILDSTLSFQYDNAAGDCSFDSNSKILSFEEQSECAIMVTVTGARGYGEESAIFRVFPNRGNLGLAWNGYGVASSKLTDTMPAPATPGVARPAGGGGVEYSYGVTSSSASVCDVDESTGVLTLKSVGECVVTVTASRSGYDNASVNVTVTVLKGDQMVGVAPPAYGGASYLASGDSLAVENEPSGHGLLTYKKKNAGDHCSVSGTTGEVTANAATGTCTIQAMRGGNTQYEASDWVDIATMTMVATGQTFVWENNPYGTTATVEVGGNLILSVPSSGGSGGAEYKTANKTICTVAANGTITGVMVGDCTVLGRWRGDSTAGVSDWVAFATNITVTQGDGPTDLTGIHAYGIHPSLKVGGVLEVLEMTLAYGSYSYMAHSGSEDFCSVDASTGRVTGEAVGRCVVEVMLLGNVNYRPSTAELLNITVQKGEQRLNIPGSPYGISPQLVMGGTLELVRTPSASHGGNLIYRVKSGSGSYCSVGSANGTIAALAPGECTIEAQAEANANYNASDWMEIDTVVVEAGTLSGISWLPQQVEGTVGDDLLLDALSYSGAGVPVVITYEVVDAGGTGCTFKGSSGNDARTLTFEDAGRCTVAAKASHAHYHTWEREHSVRVHPGTIDFTATNFPNGVKLKVGSSVLRRPGAITGLPSGVVVSWQLMRGERDCIVVNPQTGAVRARAVPIVDGVTRCSLIAVAEKKGYRTARRGPAEILLERGDLGTIHPPNYGIYNELPVGGRALLLQDAHEDHHAQLTLSYSARGTDSSDQAKTGVCSLDGDGNVSAGSSGVLGDKCIISTIATAVGYNDPTTPVADVTLTLKENLLFGALPTPMWDGILVVGKSTPLNQTVTSFPGSDQSDPVKNVTWHYSVAELGGDGSIKTAGHVCTVNRTSGRVIIGSNPTRGDNCLVRIEAYADTSHITYTQVGPVVLRVHGVLGAIASPVYRREGFGPSEQLIADGGELEVARAPHEAAHIGIEVSYQVTGKRGGASTPDICSVDNGGTVRAGADATMGDTCEVVATASAHLYEDKDADTVVLNVVNALEFTPEPSLNYSGNLRYASSTALPPSPSLPVTDAHSVDVVWEYRVALSAAGSDPDTLKNDVCVINTANGELTLGSAAAIGDVCLIQAVGRASGYADYLLEQIVEVVPGALSFASATMPSYHGTLRVTGTLAPTVPDSLVDDHGIDVTWGHWRVAESDRDGSDDRLNDGDVCSLDESGVISANGYAASAGDTCMVYATATAENYEDQEEMVGNFTLGAQGSFTSLTAQTYTDDLLVGGDAVAMATPPGAVPSDGTTWTYRATGTRSGASTDNICSVDEDGSVTPGSAAVSGDICTVSAIAHHNGYATASPPSAILIVKEVFDSVTWDSFPASATVGVNIDLSSNQPTSSPVADSYTISIVSGDCAYDGEGNTLSFSGRTACQVKVVASKAHYADSEATFSVTPGAGTLSFASVPVLAYHGRMVEGDTTTWLSRDALPAEDDNGVSVTWNLVLRGWRSRGSTTPVNNVCILNPHNGNIRLQSGRVGNVCDAHVVGQANGYNDYTSVAHFLIVVEGVFSFASTPVLTYSGALKYADTSTQLSPSGLPGVDDRAVSLTWHYALQGRDSTDANDKDDVCTMVNSTVGHADYGKVQLGSAAVVNDICRVSAVARATGYEDYTSVADLDLVVELGVQSAPTGWSDHYGSSPTVGVGGTLETSGTDPANPVSDGGALEYRVKSGGCEIVSASSGEVRGSSQGSCVIEARFGAVADKYTASDYSDVQTITITMGSQSYTWTQSAASETFGNELVLVELTGTPDGANTTYEIVSGGNTAGCAIKGSSGAQVRTLTFSDDGSCQVRTRVVRSGYGDWTSSPVAITVNPAAWTTDPAWAGYASSNRATYGSAAPALQNPTSVPSAGWTYSTSSDAGICAVAEDSGVLTINGAGDCVVTATPDLAGYGNPDGIEQTVTIALGTQSTPTGWSNHYGTTPTVMVGATKDVIGSEPTNSIDEGGALEYHVKSGGCTVDPSSGQVTGTTTGPCVIEARFQGVANKYSASNYSDVATITVEMGTQSYTAWGQADQTIRYSSGGELALTEFTGPPGSATINYEITGTNSAVCSWKGSSGADVRTLNFGDDGTCDVQVRVTRSNYNDWTSATHTITVRPAAWISAPQWSGFRGVVRFGARVTRYHQSSDPMAHWTYSASPSSVCNALSNGNLVMVAPGTCTMTATPHLAGYGTHPGITHTFTIQQGIQTAPSGWSNPYGASPMIRESGPALSLDSGSTKPTGHGDLEFQIESSDATYCSINANTGSVTALSGSANQICLVQARFAGNTNYQASAYATIATLTVGSALGTLAVTPPVFTEGTKLYVGNGNVVTVETHPSATDSSSNAAVIITSSYSAQGKRAGVDTANICSVPLGDKVTVGSAAQASDTCEVTVTVSATGYDPVDVTVTLTVQAAITFTQLYNRVLNKSYGIVATCRACHSTWTTDTVLDTAGVLDRDPTQASLWKRLQRAHDYSNGTLGNVMPQNCTTDGTNVSNCVPPKDVEYVASFLRGGSWESD